MCPEHEGRSRVAPDPKSPQPTPLRNSSFGNGSRAHGILCRTTSMGSGKIHCHCLPACTKLHVGKARTWVLSCLCAFTVLGMKRVEMEMEMKMKGQKWAPCQKNSDPPLLPHSFRILCPHQEGVLACRLRVLFSSAAGGAYRPIAIRFPSLGPFPSMGGGAHRPLTTLSFLFLRAQSGIQSNPVCRPAVVP